jgi:hypothetical protein
MTDAEIQALIDAAKTGTDDRVTWSELQTILEALKGQTSLTDLGTPTEGYVAKVVSGAWAQSAEAALGIQNKGAVAGTVSFNLALYSDFTLSISANITASFGTPPTPAYILLEVTHTVAGTTITGLPGTFDDDFAWAAGAGDVTVLAGRYNGTAWNWTSSVYS